MSALELLVAREGGRVRLLCPAVGLFTEAVPRGRALTGGDAAGVLVSLGIARALIVPPGASGRVANDAPERVHAPVERGSTLYELETLAQDAGASARTDEAADPAGGLVFRSPSAGRYWRRSRPEDAALVDVGAELADGRALGLIEVMKTFTRVVYRAGSGLPARARVARVLVADGAEVTEGQPLFALEPA